MNDAAGSVMRLVACPHCETINRVSRDRLGDGPKCGQCKQPLFPGHDEALRDFRPFAVELVRAVGGFADQCKPGIAHEIHQRRIVRFTARKRPGGALYGGEGRRGRHEALVAYPPGTGLS